MTVVPFHLGRVLLTLGLIAIAVSLLVAGSPPTGNLRIAIVLGLAAVTGLRGVRTD